MLPQPTRASSIMIGPLSKFNGGLSNKVSLMFLVGIQKENLMRKTIIASLALVLLFIVGVRAADEQPKVPQPQKEHEWLKQLAGDWDLDVQMQEPGKDITKAKGTESARLIGP